MNKPLFLVCAAVLSAPSLAFATTYQVGADKPYATIQDTLGLLAPGDVVEVDGDAVYPGDLWFRAEQGGTPDAPVTVRGIPINGKRPVISGIGTEQYHNIVVFLNANNFVFEGFEVTGAPGVDDFGIVHKADNVTVRNVVVHDIPGQGLLGTDFDSGSLTLESSEFYNNGSGQQRHQIYMATDESVYPGAVFRMQFCYVHDSAGGNNVKSRSERNEIYFNWIEGALYHELDLIGPDGQDPSLAREDSDVVGNVLVKHSEWRIARIGGDGTGNTAGRYRFVNNTMVLSASADVAIGLQQSVESVEMHNNVLVRAGAAGGVFANHLEIEGSAAQWFGSNNWVQSGFTDIPPSFTNTLSGGAAGFMDEAGFDLRLAEGSPLIEQGTSSTLIGSPGVPQALDLPTFIPPSRLLSTHGNRPEDAALDIGAFEFGTGTEPGEGTVSTGVGAPGTGPGAGPGAGAGSASGSGGDGGANADADGDLVGSCNCVLAEAPSQPNPGLAALACAALIAAGRRARRAQRKGHKRQ